MAEYGIQQRGGGLPGSDPRQRDAAYNDIFGSQRSQTLPVERSYQGEQRSMTMNVQQMGSRGPSNPRPPMERRPYGSEMYNSRQDGGGYYQNQRQPSGGLMQQQPIPQNLPPPMNPSQRQYAQPQRIDPRMDPRMPPQNYGQPQFNRPIPNRGPPGPAMNSDQYRSRSMATMGAPGYAHQNNTYQNAAANSFRQPQYYNTVQSRTTAQGRQIPERHDERTMSMNSWAADADRAQTMSGRVIPRRRESGADATGYDPYSPNTNGVKSPHSMQSASSSTARSSTMTSMSNRTMSMASTIAGERTDSLQHRPSLSKTVGSGTSSSTLMKSPLVYPALLSRVAAAFFTRIEAGDRQKNALEHKAAFTGKEAVDLIAYIIKTSDRNLALLLGRALDAQKFFHDVDYEHRLRDSPSEVYQFKEMIEDTEKEVNGVFTLLTECYSPTCTRDQLCYSIACPRRLEQQNRLNLKPQPGLKRQTSTASLHAEENDEQKLWINTVSKEIADSIDDREKKRQEIIAEIMYTERDFVKDLEYLRDFWIKPLRSNTPNNFSFIPEVRREKFVRTVFSNVMDVHAVNAQFAQSLTRRQQESPIVKNVGDIFLQYVPRFDPFVYYGARQIFGKYEFEREKSVNPTFARFVEETERLKESRKLELNGYLTKPTTRLARYPLLLEQVLKNTADGNPDKDDIPKATLMIKEFLTRVNTETGKAENRFNLVHLANNLKFPPGDNSMYVDLKLTEEGREIVYKGGLKKSPTDTNDIMCFLFDHALLLTKQKISNKKEELKVYRRPIPLELLVVPELEEFMPKTGVIKRPTSSMALGAARAVVMPPRNNQNRETFPITFRYLGKPPYQITLYASSYLLWKKWMESIETRQSKLRERVNIYDKTVLCENFFNSLNRVNCLVPIDGGRKLVYGTDTGVYVSDRRPRAGAEGSKPRKALDVQNVTQIDVLEEYQILLVLANKALLSFPLEALDPNENLSAPSKRPRKIQNHAGFFQTGVCVGRHLVCSAKASGMSTTIKVFEPMETQIRNARRMGGFSNLFQGSQETLKPFKEFYIPTEKSTSIHFLKTKLCVACSKGFEIVSLETLETQPLLDQADTSLDFVAQAKDARPIHIERLNGEFLLNYSEFSFFIDRNGWRVRPEWKINWEGSPQAFALAHPYIVAFEPSFIEVRHIDTGACVHILTAKNIRMLHSSTREIIYAYEEESGEDVVAALDFWKGSQGG